VIATAILNFEQQRIRIDAPFRMRHAVTLDIKEDSAQTISGVLNRTLSGPREIIETQSFLPLQRRDAERHLRMQRNQLI
jgi:type IV secretory pathway VirB4 component